MRLALTTLVVALLVSQHAPAQIITTLIGNGTSACTGEGGPYFHAQISDPHGLNFDANGNLYYTDLGASRLRKVYLQPTGTITSIAGNGSSGYSGDGGAATAASMLVPYNTAIDRAGNVYCGNSRGMAVRMINTSGIISIFAGNRGSGTSGDGGAATAASIDEPNGVLLDTAGNLYVCLFYQNRVRKVSTSGIITTVVGTGVSGSTGDGGAATAARLNNPNFMTIAPDGSIYISENGGHRIRKVDSRGIISTVAGTGSGGFSGDGGAATAAKLYFPAGLALDSHNNLYICDYGNHRIRMVDAATGIIKTIAGTAVSGYSGDGGPATAAQVQGPLGLAIRKDVLYFTDRYNNRIRTIRWRNSKPYFDFSNEKGLTTCANTPLTIPDSLLSVHDSDEYQLLTWSATAPAHGTITSLSSDSVVATGGISTPNGHAVYTPTPGYTGADTFVVRVIDGIDTAFHSYRITVTQCQTSGLPSVNKAESICIYPNPVESIFTVTPNGSFVLGGEAQIMDAQGRIVERFITEPGTSQTFKTGLSAGIYYLRCTSQHSVFIEKLIVK